MPNVAMFEIAPGEHVIGIDNGGGGYGDPLDRDVERVREDVIERWVTRPSAEHIYGVLFTGKEEDETLVVDLPATATRRDELRRRRVLFTVPVPLGPSLGCVLSCWVLFFCPFSWENFRKSGGGRERQ